MYKKIITGGLALFLLVLIFFIGRWTKECTEKATITISDSLKAQGVNFVPDTEVSTNGNKPIIILKKEKANIDSINRFWESFWKDSLKEQYGKGRFEVVTKKEDKYGSREYKFLSRTPPDPEGIFIVNEDLHLPVIYPSSTIGIFGGIENRFDKNIHLYSGLKYYAIDTRHFQIYAKGEINYLLDEKKFGGNIRIQTEIRF